MKYISAIILSILLFTFCGKSSADNNQVKNSDKVIVAYVTSWSSVMPDPSLVTHINYAFGHVNESFNGVRIDNENRLRRICELKQQAPSLKVLLSIGGWESGRFSEMAANETFRKAFAADCQRVVSSFGLDGIDIDWEYPTSSSAGISSSPDDTKNYTLLMRDIRNAIGNSKFLTLASAANARYYDFAGIDPYVNFINIMAYDMGSAPRHHSALFRSSNAGGSTSEEAVNAHINAGVPRNKLVLGMPFYGRCGGDLPNSLDYNRIILLEAYEKHWDDVAKVPYLTKNGVLVCGYDDPQSLGLKCQYILDQGLLGAMYWDYAGDNSARDLSRAVLNGLKE